MAANHTTQALLEHGASQLAGRSDSAGLDAELLLAHVLNVPRARFRSHPEDVPAAGARALYLELIERRARGEPLAYIVGYRDFWTLQLAVTPAVLVPRPETELLVERALAVRSESTGTLVDLGTGSGAIALALASERPGWQVTATDLSGEALAVARGNAASHGLARVEFLQGSWFEPLAGRRFDLVVSNPPYIGADEPEMSSPALRFEPRGALTPAARAPREAMQGTQSPHMGATHGAQPPSSDAAQDAAQGAQPSRIDAGGGASTPDALACLHAIIQSAPPHLEPGGWLLLEHGSTQAAAVARALVERGFRHVRSHRDLAGHERMTEGQWPPPVTTTGPR
jgi:release factor glutamine methyltransferase